MIDHLFESTSFAIFLGVLTLCFAKERASVRHGLWFAASVKFLIPFSLIVIVGETLRWDTAPAVTLDLAWAAPVMPLEFQLPTTVTSQVALPEATPIAFEAASGGVDLGLMLFGIWLAGVALLLCRWSLQWLRLHQACQSATRAAIDLPIPVYFSRMPYGPGLVGVFQPVLLLPEGIAAHLTPDQLEFVIKHELAHWRRRDNLTGAIHMTVQLMFWFHPLVWWIGARLVAERERACDESVLAAGNDPVDYADSILGVCRFYIQSPLVCASGVAGANLKDRVERIMTNIPVPTLSLSKSLLLGGVAAAALLLPVASGLFTPGASAAIAPRVATAQAMTVKTQPVLVSAVKPMRKPAPPVRKTPSVVQETLPARVAVDERTERVGQQLVDASSPAPAGAPASAGAIPSSAIEEIIVTSQRIREYVRARNFVRDYTAPSSFLDQISRWGAPLCVRTEGLTQGYNAFVTARVKEVAGQTGAPLAKTDDCEVNVSVIFTEHPQTLLDHIRTERPDLLGPHYPARRKDLATVTYPIQAWYATGTRDSRGRWTLDRYGWNEPIPGEGPPVYYTLGSHLRTGLTSEFASVVIVADIAKVSDREIGTVADYIAMTALARMKTVDKCQQLPSISNVLGVCGAELTARALSPYDIAYLKALYASASDAPSALQTSGIGYYMIKILEDQVTAQK